MERGPVVAIGSESAGRAYNRVVCLKAVCARRESVGGLRPVQLQCCVPASSYKSVELLGAGEITAYLHQNPDVSGTLEQNVHSLPSMG
jgi:hypothetical protein